MLFVNELIVGVCRSTSPLSCTTRTVFEFGFISIMLVCLEDAIVGRRSEVMKATAREQV